MQKLARQLWAKRAERMGIRIEPDPETPEDPSKVDPQILTKV
jgi:hypothetical protein